MKLPRYIAIAKELEEKILNNVYKKNERLPAERVLAEEYNVTRVTVRNAIDYLVLKGLLEKRVGSGNYIKKNTLNLNISEQLSFSEKSHFLNQTPHTDVIEFKEIYADSKLIEIFNCKSDEIFFFIKRVRYLDDIPANLENTYLPKKLFPELSKDIMLGSKYDFVERTLSIKESYNKITPILPDKDLVKIFDLKESEPIFYKTSIGISKDDIAFEYSELYFNPKIYEFSFISKR
ncbi:MAG: GntR family transcriptional regulator [Fusobacteriaceae bacterium]|uniref:GntR family transcriptional regulator n=1 Tax=Cetobacterium sp. TaxID=2071632 RepID=UPI003F2A18B9